MAGTTMGGEMGWLFGRSTLARLHSGQSFESFDDMKEFERRLEAELEKGTIERVPVGRLYSYVNPEEWYRDKKTGVVYRYIPPDYPFTGMWARVEDPERRSFFEQVHDGDAPSPEEYGALVQKLEALWLRGEVERAPDVDTPLKGVMLYHHSPTDETFELTPPGELTPDAMWRKVFRSHASGSWPGELQKDIPPPRNRG